MKIKELINDWRAFNKKDKVTFIVAIILLVIMIVCAIIVLYFVLIALISFWALLINPSSSEGLTLVINIILASGLARFVVIIVEIDEKILEKLLD